MPDADLLVNTRTRHVFTNEDWKLLNRCTDMLNSRGIKLRLKCGSSVCPAPDITIAKDDRAPRGGVLRCGCTDIHFAEPQGRHNGATVARKVFGVHR